MDCYAAGAMATSVTSAVAMEKTSGVGGAAVSIETEEKQEVYVTCV